MPRHAALPHIEDIVGDVRSANEGVEAAALLVSAWRRQTVVKGEELGSLHALAPTSRKKFSNYTDRKKNVGNKPCS